MGWTNKLFVLFFAGIYWLLIGFFYVVYMFSSQPETWAHDWRPIVQTVAYAALGIGPVLTCLFGALMYNFGRVDATVEHFEVKE